MYLLRSKCVRRLPALRRPVQLPFRSSSASAASPLAPLAIKLRQYQEDCIDSVVSHIANGHRRLGVSLATGSGKTVVFTHLISRVPQREADGTQTLILAHRRELVEQAVRHCAAAYPSATVEVEMGKQKASGYADVTVASVASISQPQRLEKFDPRRFKLLLVDEAHHIVAKSYLRVLEHFGLVKSQEPAPVLVGVSATLSRFDGLRLGKAIDRIVYHKDYVDMIGEKWLSEVVFTTVKSHVDLSKVKADSFGDFAVSSLSRAVNTPQANDIAVRAWMARAQDRKSTLVFCVDTAHVRDLKAAFRAQGVDARSIIGSDRPEVRGSRLDDFKAGKYPVLLNCGVFTEGTDIPNIDCVLIARPTRSRNLLVQMIGRGMRLFPEKKDCHVIDLVASLDTGIVTVPTLFGLDPDEIVGEAKVHELKQLKELKAKDESPTQDNPISRVTFTDYESVHDLITDKSGDRHIRALSRYAWVEVDQDRYILSNKSGEFVTIEADPEDGQSRFRVRFNEKVRYNVAPGKRQPFKRTREIAKSTTFEGAVRAADTFVKEHEEFESYVIMKQASWRSAPATEGQLAFLNKIRDPDDQLASTDVSKGEAADMISKIKFGARGRFGRIKGEAGRQQRKVARAQELAAREQTRVGPLEV